MIGDYTVECPFCGKRIWVRETTSLKHRSFGLVYLVARCIDCDIRIDAAAHGEQAAKDDMQRRVDIRRGTPKEKWQIKVTPEKKRTSGRRR